MASAMRLRPSGLNLRFAFPGFAALAAFAGVAAREAVALGPLEGVAAGGGAGVVEVDEDVVERRRPRAMRLPVFYASVRRVSRSHYEAHFQQLWDGREILDPNQITERYARACEVDVLRSPADWLWSYRRWKLKKPLYGNG